MMGGDVLGSRFLFTLGGGTTSTLGVFEMGTGFAFNFGIAEGSVRISSLHLRLLINLEIISGVNALISGEFLRGRVGRGLVKSLCRISAISRNALRMLSPVKIFGMLFLLGFFKMWIISVTDCSIASASVKTGIGVV